MPDRKSPDLSGYVEVHERITKFYERHPEGSLQSSWSLKQLNGKEVIVVEARAYRSPEDPRPGIGLASEPVPGQTSFTRDSELMNAETSAWGRALAALGFEVHRGIASGNEVRSRGGGGDEPATQGQRDYILGKGKRPGLLDKAMLGAGQRKAIVQFVSGAQKLDKAGASQIITALKEEPEKGAQGLLDQLSEAAAGGDANAQKAVSMLDSEVPTDDEGLPPTAGEPAGEGGQVELEET